MKRRYVKEELLLHIAEVSYYASQLRALTDDINDIEHPLRVCRAVTEALPLLTKRREAILRLVNFAKENRIAWEIVDPYGHLH